MVITCIRNLIFKLAKQEDKKMAEDNIKEFTINWIIAGLLMLSLISLLLLLCIIIIH